jgi:hypothetical protein
VKRLNLQSLPHIIDLPDSGIVTISQSRNHVSVWNETSAFIISSLAEQSPQEIAKNLADYFNLPFEQTLFDVELTAKNLADQERLSFCGNVQSSTAIIAKSELRYFNVEGHILSIEAPSAVIAMVMQLWAHLETVPALGSINLKIQMIDELNGSLSVMGEKKIDLAPVHVLLGGAYQQIVERLHPKLKWCAFIHAASVSLNGNGVILAAQSGSGKSTLTAMLVAHGYQYHSDDMVPLTLQSNRIASFPLPISVKPGAVKALAPIYACLDAAETAKTQYVIQDASFVGDMPKAKALVFPKYVKDATTRFEDISVSDALAKLFEDRIHFGYPVEPARVQNFVDWLSSIPRKTLVYSKFEEAEKCLSNLLQG